MYMARSFMIHSSLHWTDHGSDDLFLWSFAVDHAGWLYNRIPQCGSGIAPLEFLTRERDFYHRDLRRSHVWGCPAYVLEASLQDGKKIPKWNRRARMGQFLGFSRQHSSLVAMVRNLHTGYVSPQFHVVFDDKFDTIYTEFKTDEELEIISELEKQRRRHELKERYLRDAVQSKSNSPVPDLVPDSDDESDDDDPSSEVDSRSEGDVIQGPAGWQDHPRIANEPETLNEPDIIPPIAPGPAPNIEPAPNIVPEGGTVNEGANQRREPRRRSRRNIVHDTSRSPIRTRGTRNDRRSGNRRLRNQPRKKYNSLLNQKSVPLGVRNAIHRTKNQSFRQQMNHIRIEGDKLLHKPEMTDVTGCTVEDIMSCPLSKYIHFAANDCGYSGSRLELVTTLIHPLFLKARSEASREDNPNWKEAMQTGPFADQFWEACCTELETLED
ncbi:hypothetical protein ACHAXR_002208, partial [Thalassiosira sp. AJA248-18]